MIYVIFQILMTLSYFSADDTNLFFSHNDIQTLTRTITSEMLELSEWFKANKLTLNVKKSIYVIFKPRQRREEFDFNIEINGHKMTRVKKVTFLGVILDENLSWKPHISHIACKISKSIGIIGRSSPCLTKLALKTLYYSLVHPYFQYCIIVWGSTYPTNLNRLILLQKRIVRIVNKKPFDAYTDPLFRDFLSL